MNIKLEGKVVLVTGGSTGIGRATAIEFAKAGAKVAIAARNMAKSEETVEIIQKAGGECIYVPTDVSISKEVSSMVKKTVDTFGRLDFAINNAGISIVKDFLDWTERDWNETIDINLKGVWLCMMNEIPEMLKLGRGAIVNISSVAALKSYPMIGPYMASKQGVLSLTKSASLEFSGRGIRVNTICPGTILTPILEENMANAAAEITEEAIKGTPMGRMGKPEEVADAAVWLCSEKASFVTGITLGVDGGIAQH